MAKNPANTETKPELFRAERKVNIRLRYHVAYFLMALLVLNTIATLTAVFLNGVGLLRLDTKVLLSLIAVTVAHAATMFFSVTRNLFR